MPSFLTIRKRCGDQLCAGLTALVSKGLTAASYINLFTLILPTVMNVIIGWPDGAYDSGRKVQAGTEK